MDYENRNFLLTICSLKKKNLLNAAQNSISDYSLTTLNP